MRPLSNDRKDTRGFAVAVSGLRKYYGATPALSGAELRVRSGEIHALLGENGAGKSTLVRLLAGVEEPDAGEIKLWGRAVGRGPKIRAALGVAFIHQDLGLIQTMSVADNVALGAGFARRRGLVDRAATNLRAREILDRLALPVDVALPVGELPLAEQATVAIARALGVKARVIVMDEPTAKLHHHEVRTFFDVLARLRADGVACLLITHRIDEVQAHCDRVTVLRNGATVASRDVGEVTERELVHLITGREPHPPSSPRKARTASSECLRMDGVTGAGFGPVSFQLERGEILAVTGLADAGHRAVGETVFGLIDAAAGSMQLGGAVYRPRGPRSARRAGVAFLPADRVRDGVAERLTACENLYLYPDGGGLRFLHRRDERRRAAKVLAAFKVRPPDPRRDAVTFSGGNQQKLLLARCLSQASQLLVLNEPTGAVDIGAKFEIYELVRRHCAENRVAALVITSDFDEAALLCDRVIVMGRGRITADLTNGSRNASNIAVAAFQTAA